MAIVIVEANLPTVAEAVRDAMKDRGTPHVMFMNESTSKESAQARDLPGSVTTRRNKPEYFRLLIDNYMIPKKLVFYKHFLVAESRLGYINDVRGEYVKQLRNFCQKKVERTDSDGTTFFEIFFYGKV